MQKIKICYIISNLVQGGAERQLTELIKNLDKRKFEVSVCLYAINKGIFFTEIESVKNINLHKNTLRFKIKLLKIIEALCYLRKYLIISDFDLLHTTLFMNGLLVRMVMPKKYNNKVIHGIRSSFRQYSSFNLWIEKHFIRKSFVVTNSQYTANNLNRYFNLKEDYRITVIHNGFDLNRFYPVNNKNKDGQIIIGTVGRLHAVKNQGQLVRVFSRTNHEKLSLIIIGDDGGQGKILRQSIKNYDLENKVHIFSKITDIERFYNLFDIFILPSYMEGCPNVLFEAMLCKCFCIISANANTDIYIKDGTNGLSYDGTDNDLKRKLDYVLSIFGNVQYHKLRENGYCYAIENFSMSKMINSFENLYLNIYKGQYEKIESSNFSTNHSAL